MIPPAPSLGHINTCCVALHGVVSTDCIVPVFPVTKWSLKEGIPAPVLRWAPIHAPGHANLPSLQTSRPAVSLLLCSLQRNQNPRFPPLQKNPPFLIVCCQNPSESSPVSPSQSQLFPSHCSSPVGLPLFPRFSSLPSHQHAKPSTSCYSPNTSHSQGLHRCLMHVCEEQSVPHLQ